MLGAPEFVLREQYDTYREQITEYAEQGLRVLVFCAYEGTLDGEALTETVEPLGLVLLENPIRAGAKETFSYFADHDVEIKVISGDSVNTVRRIAAECGIEGADRCADMSAVTADEALAEAAERCNIFGRVTPAQKKKLIMALKARGHKVAMTGDGVNDVLALKEADCSVAMASGSEAARNVSRLVLVNNDFACMPQVVAEGRRTINNIERSSSLYLVKTIYSILLAVFFVFSSLSYPFQPIQLTLIGGLTIGFPSFVLALQPNKNIVRGNFTVNIVARALPAALCVVLNIILSAALSGVFGISQGEVTSIAVYITSLICLMLILRLSLPLNPLRTGMLLMSAAGLAIAFIFFRGFFMLADLTQSAVTMLLIFASATVILFNLLYHLADRFIEQSKARSQHQRN